MQVMGSTLTDNMHNSLLMIIVAYMLVCLYIIILAIDNLALPANRLSELIGHKNASVVKGVFTHTVQIGHA